MLGDLRVLDTGDELLLDCERVALQELFNMIRRYKLGRDVELHKRTLECGAALADRARRARGRRRRRPAGAEHAHRARRARRRRRRALIATDLGVDVLCAAADTRARRARRSSPPAPCRPTRRPPRSVASRPAARATASTSTTASIPQEAGLNERAVSFTKGCYVGQETVARLLLPRQAEPPPARPAAERAGGRRGRRCGWASARSAGSASVVDSPAHGPIALALVRREAAPGDTVAVGDGGIARARSSTLPFALA